MKKSKLLFMTSVGMAAVLIGCTKTTRYIYLPWLCFSTCLNWNPHSWETNADTRS